VNGREVFPASARRRRWSAAAGGAVLALGGMEIALTLGLYEATTLDPVLLRMLALAVGAALALTRLAPVLWIGSAAAALLLLLVMFTPVVERPALSLLRADAESGSAQAVVVYSAGFTDAGHINDIALTRLVSGLDDARELGIGNVLVSEQVRRVRGRAISTADDQRRLVRLLGNGTTVHVVSGVSNTHNESLAFAAYARTRNWTHVRVVTSPLHSRRACASLEATGVRVTCAPSTSRDVAITALDSPRARLIALRAALHEHVGLLVYGMRGWL
jgi:uncharacterized SAM-binding protein YcdF (DUF218 family)